jgi:hypothetical protein
MIVYELITLRRGTHLPAGKAFESSYCAGAFVECRVLDNGSAPGKRPAGRGLKIVYELTKGLGGRFRAEFWNGRINFYLNVPARWGNGKNPFSTKGPTRQPIRSKANSQNRIPKKIPKIDIGSAQLRLARGKRPNER